MLGKMTSSPALGTGPRQGERTAVNRKNNREPELTSDRFLTDRDRRPGSWVERRQPIAGPAIVVGLLLAGAVGGLLVPPPLPTDAVVTPRGQVLALPMSTLFRTMCWEVIAVCVGLLIYAAVVGVRLRFAPAGDTHLSREKPNE